MDADLGQQFITFVQDPTRENYLRLFASVTSLPDYAPYSNDLHSVQELLDQERYADAAERIREVMGRNLLSPRIHYLASFAAHKRGDDETAKMEWMFYLACVEGIRGTGDGSEARPYVVTSTGDEYDLLAHDKKELKGQALVERAGRHFDRMECADGSVVWFDITTPYGAMGRKMGLG